MASQNQQHMFHDANVLDVDTPRLSSTTSVPPETRSDTPHERVPPIEENPFWNVNIPAARHTQECPSYLLYALENDKDRGILSTPDALYKRQTWPEVQSFIQNNRLDLFQRVPSELHLYRQYCSKLAEQYGSVMEFVSKARLGWTDLTPSTSSTGNPFDDPENYKILHNDWPYGVDERITHLVVWTKFSLPLDPTSAKGDISPRTRQMIQKFVDDATCGTEENVIWFLNWASLKSIHSVEHFHVMLFNADDNFVRTITAGDVPLKDKLKKKRNDGGQHGRERDSLQEKGQECFSFTLE